MKDLQKEYKAANNMEQSGYPQAALFIKKGSEEKVAAYRKEAEAFVKKADDTSIAGAGNSKCSDCTENMEASEYPV